MIGIGVLARGRLISEGSTDPTPRREPRKALLAALDQPVQGRRAVLSGKVYISGRRKQLWDRLQIAHAGRVRKRGGFGHCGTRLEQRTGPSEKSSDQSCA